MTAAAQSTELFGAALRGEFCEVVGDGAAAFQLPVERWCGAVDRSDRALLRHCRGATLDVGCGPGRMVEHLARAGRAALGIDVSPEAVARTVRRGAAAILRDVHAPLPAEGRWETVLLADGNIGIGGDPRRLLARVAGLLAPGGRVVVDLAPPGAGVRTDRVRLRTTAATSEPFAWSTVSVDAIDTLARAAGFAEVRRYCSGGRWFAVAVKAA